MNIKPLSVAILTFCFFALSAFKFVNTIEVPLLVKEAFAKKYPTAQQIEWEVEEKGVFEAEFKINEKEMSANFSEDGRWLKTEIEMEEKDLPKAIKDVVALQFQGYEIEEAEQVEQPDSAITYELELENNEENLEIEVNFSMDGRILEKKVTGDKDEEKDDDQ